MCVLCKAIQRLTSSRSTFDARKDSSYRKSTLIDGRVSDRADWSFVARRLIFLDPDVTPPLNVHVYIFRFARIYTPIDEYFNASVCVALIFGGSGRGRWMSSGGINTHSPVPSLLWDGRVARSCGRQGELLAEVAERYPLRILQRPGGLFYT